MFLLALTVSAGLALPKAEFVEGGNGDHEHHHHHHDDDEGAKAAEEVPASQAPDSIKEAFEAQAKRDEQEGR